MMPGLAPGDFVLIDPRAYDDRSPDEGEVVLIRHPYQPIEMVKRVSDVLDDGIVVIGDNESASTDSRAFGRIRRDQLLGRVTSRIS